MNTHRLVGSFSLLAFLSTYCLALSSNPVKLVPSRYSLQQVPGLSQSSSSISDESKSSIAESSEDEHDREVDVPRSDASKLMMRAASELLNESQRVEDNFISRMQENCWEQLPDLNVARR